MKRSLWPSGKAHGCFYLAQLFLIDWQLTLTFLIIAPLLAGLFPRVQILPALQLTNARFMGEVTQITSETIKGYKVIRTLNADRMVNDKLASASERNRHQNMKLELTRNTSTPLVQMIVAMGLAFLVWLAMSPDFFAGRSAGEFVIFLSAAGLLAKPIRQLTQINAVIQRGIAASFSIFELLDEPSELNRGQHAVRQIDGRVEFRDVWFSYNDHSSSALKASVLR